MALLFVGVVQPATSFANTWAACSTITAMGDYRTDNGSVALILTPVPTWTSGSCGSNSVEFLIGAQGVTSDTIAGSMAMSLAAFISGQQIKVFYDRCSCRRSPRKGW